MCSICPSDIETTMYLIGIIVIISIVTGVLSKKIFLPFVILSVLSNIIFLLAVFSHSLLFRIYNIELFSYFSVFIWPIVNIVLIIILTVKYLKSKKKNETK